MQQNHAIALLADGLKNMLTISTQPRWSAIGMSSKRWLAACTGVQARDSLQKSPDFAPTLRESGFAHARSGAVCKACRGDSLLNAPQCRCTGQGLRMARWLHGLYQRLDRRCGDTSPLPDIGAFTGWLLQAVSMTLRHPQIHHKHRPIVTPYLLARTVASGFLPLTW
uniref:Ctb2 n=1 Tax=Comamonas testosteroni TaxID=285 RepID=Q2KQ76_COMTE|nr:Ctb2 [Comamonas testosteroni]